MDTNEDYINIKELLFILKKRFLLILSLAVLTTALAWGYNQFHKAKAEYYTTTELIFNIDELTKPITNYAETTKNSDMVNTYLALVKSPLVMNQVATKLKMEGQKTVLNNMVSVDTLKNTPAGVVPDPNKTSNIITISVHNPDPKVAMDVANTVAVTFKDEVKNIFKVDNITVLSPAKDTEAVLPQQSKNLIIGFIGGLALGVVLALCLEYLNRNFRKEQEVEKALRTPVLASVPAISGQGGKLIAKSEPAAPISEAYRTLRTEMELAGDEKEKRNILVTSAVQGDGKSVTAANLAVVMGEQGYNTLYIQADLRNNANSLFAVGNSKGLSTYLSGQASFAEVVQETDIPNVSVLPAGPIPANPGQLFTPGKVEELLAIANGQFQRVIIDAPAVTPFAEGLIMGNKVDGCLFVVKAGKTDRKVAFDATEKLLKTKANLLGVVFNQAR